MKKTKILIATAILGVATFVAIAADHIDAPGVTGETTDITDFYAFEAESTNNIAFVANVQGLLAPGDTGSASFDENVIIEINIDTDGDNIEDLVIQAVPRNDQMYFFGPVEPNQTGLSSTIMTNAVNQGVVNITPYGTNAITSVFNGMQFFAGPRDDPFFFDFTRYTQIVTPGDDDGDGMEETAFLPEGDGEGFASDTFAGTNVLSVVVEVPKSMIGGSGTINTWVETKRRQ